MSSETLGGASSTDRSVRSDRVLVAVEQLRREVPGGIGTYATGLLTGLVQLDPEDRPVMALLASKVHEKPDPLRCFGFPVITSMFGPRTLPRLWDLNLVRAKTGASVVHAVSFQGPSSPSPVSMMVHDLAWRVLPETFPLRGRVWHEAALRRAARRVQLFMVPSDPVADALAGAGLGIRPERILVVSEGADHLPPPDLTATARTLSKLGVQGEFLLAVGTLEPRKNLRRLIEAYERIRTALPEPWPLVVVGPTGWGTSPRTGGEGVIFAGKVSSAVLAGLYSRARTVAYVPLLEGFGLPVVEAMRAGTPVVSSAVPAALDATQLVDPYDVDSIAEGLLAVAPDDTRREELCRRGAVRVAPLTWRATAQAHVGIWHQLALGNV